MNHPAGSLSPVVNLLSWGWNSLCIGMLRWALHDLALKNPAHPEISVVKQKLLRRGAVS